MDEYYLRKPYYKNKDSEPDYSIAEAAKKVVEELKRNE
jgi:hypothetical protein